MPSKIPSTPLSPAPTGAEQMMISPVAHSIHRRKATGGAQPEQSAAFDMHAASFLGLAAHALRSAQPLAPLHHVAAAAPAAPPPALRQVLALRAINTQLSMQEPSHSIGDGLSTGCSIDFGAADDASDDGTPLSSHNSDGTVRMLSATMTAPPCSPLGLSMGVIDTPFASGCDVLSWLCLDIHADDAKAAKPMQDYSTVGRQSSLQPAAPLCAHVAATTTSLGWGHALSDALLSTSSCPADVSSLVRKAEAHIGTGYHHALVRTVPVITTHRAHSAGSLPHGTAIDAIAPSASHGDGPAPPSGRPYRESFGGWLMTRDLPHHPADEEDDGDSAADTPSRDSSSAGGASPDCTLHASLHYDNQGLDGKGSCATSCASSGVLTPSSGQSTPLQGLSLNKGKGGLMHVPPPPTPLVNNGDDPAYVHETLGRVSFGLATIVAAAAAGTPSPATPSASLSAPAAPALDPASSGPKEQRSEASPLGEQQLSSGSDGGSSLFSIYLPGFSLPVGSSAARWHQLHPQVSGSPSQDQWWGTDVSEDAGDTDAAEFSRGASFLSVNPLFEPSHLSISGEGATDADVSQRRDADAAGCAAAGAHSNNNSCTRPISSMFSSSAGAVGTGLWDFLVAIEVVKSDMTTLAKTLQARLVDERC